MINGPKLWSDLIQQSPKGSVLMGGAIVDYLAGVKPKDYDIFHKYKEGQPVVPPWWKLQPPVDVDIHEEEYLAGVNLDGNHPIGSIYNYLVDNQYKVQLIGVLYEDPLQHFKNFDHSLTLGRWTQNGLFVHEKVFGSLDTLTIEYVSKNHSAQSVNRSLERAKAKVLRYGWQGTTYKNFNVNLQQEEVFEF